MGRKYCFASDMGVVSFQTTRPCRERTVRSTTSRFLSFREGLAMMRIFLTLVFVASLFLLQDHFSELSQVSDRGNGHLSVAISFSFPLYLVSVLEMFGWIGLILARIRPKPMGSSVLTGFAGGVTFLCCLCSIVLSGLALGSEDQAGGAPYQHELTFFYVLKVICLAGLMIELFLWFFDREATSSQSAF